MRMHWVRSVTAVKLLTEDELEDIDSTTLNPDELDRLVAANRWATKVHGWVKAIIEDQTMPMHPADRDVLAVLLAEIEVPTMENEVLDIEVGVLTERLARVRALHDRWAAMGHTMGYLPTFLDELRRILDDQGSDRDE